MALYVLDELGENDEQALFHCLGQVSMPINDRDEFTRDGFGLALAGNLLDAQRKRRICIFVGPAVTIESQP
jgi:hypothetical protein